jgi:glucose/arabinose dehydrogenase
MLKKFQQSERPWLWIASLLLVIILIGLGVSALTDNRPTAFAQEVFGITEVELTQVAYGLVRPVFITHASDGSGRIFIVEQRGKIFILDEDVSEQPFLDIEDRVASPASGGGNEEGLLSLAFPPSYAEKGYVYVYYTMHDGDNVLSRFSLSSDPNRADPDSEEQILVFPHPQYSNHNGGQIVFGPDGYLYIGTGDGGGGGDPQENAQDPSSLNGKLLRIDVEPPASEPGFYLVAAPPYWVLAEKPHEQASDENYLIPNDNPFVDDPEVRSEIWAL